MERFIENYTGKEFDLLVIGGGITGVSVAYEAASRGLSVALIEKNDFASATSSATSRMIHGGLRYLSIFEFRLVRESLRERRILSDIAPNFIHPLPFIFSMYKKNKITPLVMKIGMMLYELFSFDKNWVRDKSKKIPHFQTISAKKLKELIPIAPESELLGGQLYYDCSSHSPERFTLAFAKSAVKCGASVANYTEMLDFLIEQNGLLKKVKGVLALDKLSGEKKQIHAKLVINCSGPWADILLDKVKKNTENQELRRSEGIHIVTKKLNETYVFSGSTAKGKHFFLVPYRNKTLIGTTDKEYIGKPDDYKVTKKAILELLEDVNQALEQPQLIKYEDISYVYGGLRPLVEDQTEDVYNSSRKYEITGEKKNGIAGLLTVEGGKFTTSRMLAQKAVDKIFRILKYPKQKSISEKKYLHSSEIEDFEDFFLKNTQKYPFMTSQQALYLSKSYGNEIDSIIDLGKENEEWLKPLNSDGENLAQVVFAIRNEMAKSLTDIVLRRTGIALLGNPGKEIIEKIAQIAAKELSWSVEKTVSEIEKLEQILAIPQ